jgi:hypothetical protein
MIHTIEIDEETFQSVLERQTDQMVMKEQFSIDIGDTLIMKLKDKTTSCFRNVLNISYINSFLGLKETHINLMVLKIS